MACSVIYLEYLVKERTKVFKYSQSPGDLLHAILIGNVATEDGRQIGKEIGRDVMGGFDFESLHISACGNDVSVWSYEKLELLNKLVRDTLNNASNNNTNRDFSVRRVNFDGGYMIKRQFSPNVATINVRFEDVDKFRENFAKLHVVSPGLSNKELFGAARHLLYSTWDVSKLKHLTGGVFVMKPCSIYVPIHFKCDFVDCNEDIKVVMNCFN